MQDSYQYQIGVLVSSTPSFASSSIVYVDDFKLAGPSENLAAGWTLLRQRINMEDPGPVSHFLGCTHRTSRCKLSNGHEARVMVYDMENFMRSCVEAYRKYIPGGGKAPACGDPLSG